MKTFLKIIGIILYTIICIIVGASLLLDGLEGECQEKYNVYECEMMPKNID